MSRVRPSLKRRIILSVVLLNIATFFGLPAMMMLVAYLHSPTGVSMWWTVPRTVAESLSYRDGDLVLSPGSKYEEIARAWPGLWFVAADDAGRTLSNGPVPAGMVPFRELFDGVQSLDMRGLPDRADLQARFERVATGSGMIRVLAGGGDFAPDWIAAGVVTNLLLLIPILLLTIATIALVWVLFGGMFRGVVQIERQAIAIDFDKPGTRLEAHHIPREIAGLVDAINSALQRLDEGYEASARFFASAAHELRTPIAIVLVRLDALPDGSLRDQLKRDVQRLARMADDLLDIERLRQTKNEFRPVDLVFLAESVLEDLAAKAIAEGYDVALDAPYEQVMINGDEGSLRRLLTNLVQNAIQYGGKRGEITVRILSSGGIEVQDDGEGVPPELAERIFEPFFRAKRDGNGAGLGLKLVRDIAQLHGGSISVYNVEPRGALFCVALPLSWPAANH